MRLLITILATMMVLSLGSFIFVVKSFHLTTYEAVNKIARKLNIISESERLIQYSPRFQNDFPDVAFSASSPVNILDVDNHSNIIGTLKENMKLANLEYKCDSRAINYANYCYIDGAISAEHLIDIYLSYRFTAPKEVGSYGNGLVFAYTLDVAQSLVNVPKEEKLRLDAKLRDMLSAYLFALDGDSASLFHGRSSLASVALLLASQLDSSDSQNRDYIVRAFGHFYDFFVAFEKVEIWPEGYSYWINNRALPVILGINTLRNVSGGPELLDLRAERLLERVGLWHIYNTRPDWVIQGWGDEGSRTDLRDETSKIIDLLAKFTRNNAIQIYAKTLKKYFGGSNYYYGYSWMLPLTLSKGVIPTETNKGKSSDASLEALDDILPKTEVFGEGYSNHIVIRSGWDADSTFIQIRGADRFAHHQHYDAGSVTVFKREPLLVNASRYDNLFSEERKYFSGRSISKNTIFVLSDNEDFTPNRHYSLNILDGGQRIPFSINSNLRGSQDAMDRSAVNRQLDMAQILGSDCVVEVYCNYVLDITSAYNSIRYVSNGSKAKVRRVTRQFLYLFRSDTLLVLDTIHATDNSSVKGMYWHTANRPKLQDFEVVEGSEYDGILVSTDKVISVVKGSGSLLQHIFAFDPITVKAIGGLKYRTYIPTFSSINNATGVFVERLNTNNSWFDDADWRLAIQSQEDSSTFSIATLIEIGTKNQASSSWLTVFKNESEFDLFNAETNEKLKLQRTLSNSILVELNGIRILWEAN
ncbi:hypothetical protein [Aestuariibacter salexigens]|uniref:hypothetical protein n=1 Tax=Aestuariibacter salexigens TaxID=226010 RepID=UPI000409F39F|nr:hypothetical protein [Aestuariibacter salexigens]